MVICFPCCKSTESLSLIAFLMHHLTTPTLFPHSPPPPHWALGTHWWSNCWFGVNLRSGNAIGVLKRNRYAFTTYCLPPNLLLIKSVLLVKNILYTFSYSRHFCCKFFVMHGCWTTTVDENPRLFCYYYQNNASWRTVCILFHFDLDMIYFNWA